MKIVARPYEPVVVDRDAACVFAWDAGMCAELLCLNESAVRESVTCDARGETEALFAIKCSFDFKR
ncbi:hypothetical protein [Paraburkholderia caribensis]|uniref:hypothetical protein n=1 Tax=Paraburkholderia caribensis TaxID=75105 RepID=UPI0015914D79|nr:hypothetical protein [Paraburkholderia caribensis]